MDFLLALLIYFGMLPTPAQADAASTPTLAGDPGVETVGDGSDSGDAALPRTCGPKCKW